MVFSSTKPSGFVELKGALCQRFILLAQEIILFFLTFLQQANHDINLLAFLSYFLVKHSNTLVFWMA